MASCSSTSTYPSTGTPKLKLKITKEDKKLTVQVLEQDERFISTNRGSCEFKASNGFRVTSWTWPELYSDNICLLGRWTHDRQRWLTKGFDSNTQRDRYLARMEEALRDWAENAPEFKTTTDTTGRIVTFKSDKAEVEFVKVGSGLVMHVLSMDARFRSAVGGSILKFVARNGLEVVSSVSPGLGEDEVRLWGEHKADDERLTVLNFPPATNRDSYLTKALAALDDWSKNYEAWKVPEPTPCACSCIATPCPSACRHCHCCGHTHTEKDEYIFTV